MNKLASNIILGFSALFSLVVVLFYIIAIGFWSDASNFDKSEQPWLSSKEIQWNQNEKLIFEVRNNHPFLAEYDYRVNIVNVGDSRYIDLYPNIGGEILVNMHKKTKHELIVAHKHHVELVDTKKGSTQQFKGEIDYPCLASISFANGELGVDTECVTL